MLDRLSVTITSHTVSTTAATTDEIKFGPYAGGMISIPVGSSITTLTWNTADEPGGTYLPASDEGGAAITQTVSAGKAYQIPTALYGAHAIKPVVNSAGTVGLSLKG